MRLTLERWQAALLMVVVTLLWATAGLATRQLQHASPFEVSFIRAASCACSLLLVLGLTQKRRLLNTLLRGGWTFWGSALCWGVMFTAFMVALTMTSVGNVLVTMAVGPLLTALFSRVALGYHIAPRTWVAVLVAGCGISFMFSAQIQAGSVWGTVVAACVPIAGAINWTFTQYAQERGQQLDLVPAVLAGSTFSALFTLPLAMPLHASVHDTAILISLGLLQLALPCVLCVVCARVLKAPELSLLQLLEVVFGILLVWLGANEAPTRTVLVGGCLIIGALVGNEWLAWRGVISSREAR